ncbi:two-component system cell cycle response regulator CpdR [Ochrobactrum sp. J50]|jgi:two-component system cell cycle response regulator CpdR|nr:two-component system cell cycle response regulator CpdR [Ochrobactrum sp. J50]
MRAITINIHASIHSIFTKEAFSTVDIESLRVGFRAMNTTQNSDGTMKRILLAEDDNDMRRFLVKALEKAGYHVTHFDNGASAYERLQEEPFSLLLTDIVMPEMDGIELARRATEIDPDLKIMFITGFAAVALNPDSDAPRDAKVLSKPFHLRDLVNEIEKMLIAA